MILDKHYKKRNEYWNDTSKLNKKYIMNKIGIFFFGFLILVFQGFIYFITEFANTGLNCYDHLMFVMLMVIFMIVFYLQGILLSPDID